MIAALLEFATMVTIQTEGQQWPYISISHWERRAAASRVVTNSYAYTLSVGFTGDYNHLQDYGEYLDSDFSNWYNESLKVAGLGPPLEIPEGMATRLDPSLWNQTDNIFIVNRYISPPMIESAVHMKFDYGHVQASRWTYMRETHRRARSVAHTFYWNLVEGKEEGVEYVDPMYLFYQPIFTNFSDDKDVLGFLSTIYRWQDNFEGILDERAAGIRVVLFNTCGDVNTYEINGATATYLNASDVHDSKFDNMAVEASISMELDLNDIATGVSETASGGQSCSYSVKI